MTKKDIQEFSERINNGNGTGDPNANYNDDRKLQIYIANNQIKIGTRLNWLTLMLVITNILNIAIVAFQLYGK